MRHGAELRPCPFPFAGYKACASSLLWGIKNAINHVFNLCRCKEQDLEPGKIRIRSSDAEAYTYGNIPAW